MGTRPFINQFLDRTLRSELNEILIMGWEFIRA